MAKVAKKSANIPTHGEINGEEKRGLSSSMEATMPTQGETYGNVTDTFSQSP
jgi:hypothetical protein